MAVNNNNDIANIFKELMICLCEGKSLHNSAANLYSWISLDGFKRMHRYKAMCYGIKKIELENIAVMLNIKIPDIEYKKMDINSYNSYNNNDRINMVDSNVVKNTVKATFDAWLAMEKENLEFYNEMWHTLLMGSSKNTALSNFVKCLLDDTQCKIKYLTRKIMNFKSLEYSPLAIINIQKKYHKKYKKKLKSIKMK